VWLSCDIEVETASSVHIGVGSTVQRRCTINGSVRIGRGCILAPNVFISSGTHNFKAYPYLPIREQERRADLEADTAGSKDRPVWVQDDCWLGVNAVICPGVTVGKGSIVGANAVITRDVSPYSIVAGAPGREIGRRLTWRPPEELHFEKEEDLAYVLAGVPVLVAGSPSVRMAASMDEPLRAAVGGLPTKLYLRYEASNTMEAEVAGDVQTIATGVGTLTLLARNLRLEADHMLIDIKVISAPRNARLTILDIARECEVTGSVSGRASPTS
jgi:acetyltransferase-like isoleucine patch superfamily enzyme